MRRLIAGFMATALFAPVLAPVAASAACLKMNEGTAINMAGLKSQLMVTALSCDTRDRYNSFVLAFRPTLQAQDTALTAYFSHHYRKGAQARHDAYITQLANVQSEAGIKQGTLFCQQNVGLFNQVLEFKTSAQLQDFANNAPLIQPYNIQICGYRRHPVVVPTAQVVAVDSKTGVKVAEKAGTQKRGFFGSLGNLF
jgi:hypothetical protein